MEVQFSDQQAAEHKQLAEVEGTEPAQLVKMAALRLLRENSRFRDSVREGIAQADSGESIDEEEMNARLDQMLRT